MKVKISRAEILIKKLIHKHFSINLSYSFLTGSLALKKHILGESDIDFCIVLKENSRKIPRKKLRDKINLLILDYLKIHKTFNLEPDLLFPGIEIFTPSQLRDICIGRGFKVRKNRIYFDKLRNRDFFENIDFWYRAWLGMHCWSEYLIGSEKSFLKNRNKCCEFVFKIFLLNLPKKFRKEDFKKLILQKENVWKSFGVKEQGRLAIIEKFFYPQIKNLIVENILRIENDKLVINKKKLLVFQERIVTSLKGRKFSSAPLFSLQELKTFSLLAKKYR